MANTWQCPSCKQWIEQGLRQEQCNRMKHLKDCNSTMYKTYQERRAELDAVEDELAPPTYKTRERAERVREDDDELKPTKQVDDDMTIEWVRAQTGKVNLRGYHFHIDGGEVVMHRHDGGAGKHEHDTMVDYGVSIKLMDKKAEAMR